MNTEAIKGTFKEIYKRIRKLGNRLERVEKDVREIESYGITYVTQVNFDKVYQELDNRIDKLDKEKGFDSSFVIGVEKRLKNLEWAVNYSIPETFATSLDVKNLLTKDDIKAIKQASDVYKRYMDTASVDEIKEVYKEPEKKEVIRKCCKDDYCDCMVPIDGFSTCGSISVISSKECKYLVEETV
jgi:hypothetical protein